MSVIWKKNISHWCPIILYQIISVLYAEYAAKYLWLKVPDWSKILGWPMVFGGMELLESPSPKWFLPSGGRWYSCPKLSKAKKKVGSFCYCWWFRNPAFTSCSFTHYLQGFMHPQVVGLGISSIEGIIDLLSPSLFFVCRFSVSPLDNLVRTLRGAWVSLYPKSLQHCWYVAWQGPWMP